MATAHVPGTWRLLYFDAPTRGEQIRVLFGLAKVDFEDVRLEFPRGLDKFKTAAMGDESPLCGTDLCPAVTNPRGEHKVETADIMRWVGQQVGLAPETEAEDARAVELTAMAQQILDQSFYPCLKPAVVKRVLQMESISLLGCIAGTTPPAEALEALQQKLPLLEEQLGGEGGDSDSHPFLLGKSVTYADAAVFTTLRETLLLGCFGNAGAGVGAGAGAGSVAALASESSLVSHPLLKAWMQRMEMLATPWFERRTAEHQLGAATCVEYLALTNTPFPWRRRKKRPQPAGEPS